MRLFHTYYLVWMIRVVEVLWTNSKFLNSTHAPCCAYPSVTRILKKKIKNSS